MWVTLTYFYLDANLLPMMHPYTRFDDPTMYSCWDINSAVNLECRSFKRDMWVTVTYFHLDADLLAMMHPYTRFDDPTMYSSWDMNSAINSNVGHSSRTCGSQWPNFTWMLTYYPWCIHTPGLMILPCIVADSGVQSDENPNRLSIIIGWGQTTDYRL